MDNNVGAALYAAEIADDPGRALTERDAKGGPFDRSKPAYDEFAEYVASETEGYDIPA